MATGKYQEWLKEENLTLLEGWARDGLNDEQIAHNMGINRATLYKWKKEHGDINDALKKGKAVVDFEVENATYKNACGHMVQEITKERRFNKVTGEYEIVITKIQDRYIPPNPTAEIFWLKNRKGEVWREKQADEGNAEALEKLDGILKGIHDNAHNAVRQTE